MLAQVDIGVLLGVASFPFLWALSLFLLSRLGGWARLAKQYADYKDAPGESFYMRSGSVGMVNYGSCLNLRVSQDGLRISVLFLFRIGHPPLFIPWQAFHTVTEGGVFVRRLDACVGMPVLANLKLPIWIRDYMPVHSTT